MSKRLLVNRTDSERPIKRARALGPTPEEVRSYWTIRIWCYMIDDRLYDARAQIMSDLTFSEKIRLSMTCKLLHQQGEVFTQDERALLQWVPWTKPRALPRLAMWLVEPVVRSIKGCTPIPRVAWHLAWSDGPRVDFWWKDGFGISLCFWLPIRSAINATFLGDARTPTMLGSRDKIVAGIRSVLSRRGLLTV